MKSLGDVDKIYLSIAGFTICLHLKATEYLQSKQLFLIQLKKVYKGFITNDLTNKIDFSIYVEQSRQIEVYGYKEKKYIDYYKSNGSKNSITTYYSISLEQLTILLRYILYILLAPSGFIMHGSASILKGRAILFVGHSGAGKSTIITMLKNKILPFADDSYIIRMIHNTYLCFQTPVLDKQTWIQKVSRGFPIGEVFAIKKSKNVHIKDRNIDEVKQLLIESTISNKGSIRSFTKNILHFISTQKNMHTLYFNTNRKELSHLFGKEIL